MRRLIPHLAALLVILACIGLTRWQLDRAEEKTTLLEREATRSELDLGALAEPLDLPQPVRARGRWLGQFQLLLDNRIREHQPGVFVLTPFQLEDGRVFAVNRGWARWPSRTAPLPNPQPPAGDAIEIRGVLAEAPGVGARMGAAESEGADGWPRLQSWFDPTELARTVDSTIPDAVVRLSPNDPAHLTGDAWLLLTFGPERHRGYALTWALIALVVGLIWLTLSFRQFRDRTR